MNALKHLSIRTKAFAASLVLLLCLIGVGGNAYLTSDRAATDLNELTATNLPKQQTVAKLETAVTAIHLKVFRYVSWASNSVSARPRCGWSGLPEAVVLPGSIDPMSIDFEKV